MAMLLSDPFPTHRSTAPFTVDDLDRLPDDGLRYELVDGVLFVSPAPSLLHQIALRNLFLILRAAEPADLYVLFAPVDYRIDQHNQLPPDLLVMERSSLHGPRLETTPPLVLEVLSPSSRRIDRLIKFGVYGDAGVPHYVIVDPFEPSISAFELRDDVYIPTGFAAGDDLISLGAPIPVTLVPADLVADYLGDEEPGDDGDPATE